MSKGVNRLHEEYNKIKENDELCQIGGKVNLINNNFLHWKACLKGPKNTPLENGLFILEMKFSQNYPDERPLVQMRTPTIHPNINNRNGNISSDYLSNWNKDYNINGILHAVFMLLAYPNFHNSYLIGINESIYFEKASKMTSKYAGENQSYNWDNSWDKGWSNDI